MTLIAVMSLSAMLIAGPPDDETLQLEQDARLQVRISVHWSKSTLKQILGSLRETTDVAMSAEERIDVDKPVAISLGAIPFNRRS